MARVGASWGVRLCMNVRVSCVCVREYLGCALLLGTCYCFLEVAWVIIIIAR